jgi:hypothetical protein
MSYQPVNGRGLLTSSFRSGVMPVLYDAPQPDDFLLEYDFLAPVAGPGSGYGVLFRSDDAEGGLAHYYLLKVEPAEKRIVLQRWQDEEWVTLQESALPPDMPVEDVTSHVRLEAVGDEFAVFINNRHLLTAEDDALAAPGALGLVIVPSWGLAEGDDDFAYFDNFRVYAASPELALAATQAPTAPPDATSAPAPTPAPAPTSRPQATAAPAKQAAAGAAVRWVRGDQPYGTFDLKSEQAHTPPDAYKLAYDFPAVTGNFVVFEARPAMALPGKPSGIIAWVYGDGLGHFLNAWVKDAKGERRSYTFGPIGQPGWQQMTAWFDDARGWPNGHIDGPDNAALDFPVSLNALVLDGVPDGAASRGSVFVDDLSATTEPMPQATAAPVAGPAPAPTAAGGGPAALSGRIAVPVYAPDRATYDIYIVDPTCACMDRVLDAASQPALRNDGRRLAFRRWKDDDRGIGVMDTYGGNYQRLTNFLEDALPSWSPDAAFLVFSSRRESDRKPRLYEVELAGGPDWDVWVDGAPIFGEYPTWAADDSVFYHVTWPQTGLARLSPDGSNTAMLLGDGSATAPAVSRDGQAIAYMSQAGGSWDIYRANADGSGRVRLTEHAANDGLPAWSPDGRSIAFVSDRGGAWALWVMNADGASQRKIVDLPGPPDGHVDLEPDFRSLGWTDERISWAP